MNLKSAIEHVRSLGLSLTKTPSGEYRVTHKRDEHPSLHGEALTDKLEDSAYYTDDLVDAINTAKLMAKPVRATASQKACSKIWGDMTGENRPVRSKKYFLLGHDPDNDGSVNFTLIIAPSREAAVSAASHSLTQYHKIEVSPGEILSATRDGDPTLFLIELAGNQLIKK